MDLFQELHQTGPEKSTTRYRTADNNHDRVMKEVSEIMSLDGDDSSMLSEPDTSVMIPPSFDEEDLPLMNMIQPTIPQESLPDREMIEMNSKGQQSSTTIQLDSPIGSTAQQKPSTGTSLPGMSTFNSNQVYQGRPAVNNPSRIASTLSQEIKPDQLERTTPSQKRPTQPKRKRRDSDVIRVEDDSSESEEEFSRASSPEYNPASTLTRSGRQSIKADPIYTPAPTPTRTQPIGKKPHPNQYTVKKHPKIKAKVYRGREAFALCEHCTRQFGPPDNVIVFCDACNKCWHQRCHEPRVTKEMIADTKAEWFCAECDKILHGKKRGRPTTKPAQSQAHQLIPPPPQPQLPPDLPKIKYGMPWIPGMALTLVQKKDYLHSLPKERLIDIVMRAADLAPNMPIFETPYHLIANPANLPYQPPPNRNSPVAPLGPPPPGPISQPPPAQVTPQPQIIYPPPPKSNAPIYDHPTAKITSKPNTQPPPSNLTEEDEGYYDDYDELALLYPKPGQGVYDLALPPEYMDYGVLLEGPDCKTFSHWVKGQGEIKSVEPAR